MLKSSLRSAMHRLLVLSASSLSFLNYPTLAYHHHNYTCIVFISVVVDSVLYKVIMMERDSLPTFYFMFKTNLMLFLNRTHIIKYHVENLIIFYIEPKLIQNILIIIDCVNINKSWKLRNALYIYQFHSFFYLKKKFFQLSQTFFRYIYNWKYSCIFE